MILNTIQCGDCIEGMKQIPDKTFDLLVTDPPYGLDFNGKENYYGVRDKELVIDGYKDVERKEYGVFSRAWIRDSVRVLKDNGSGYIVSGWSNLEDVLAGLREAQIGITNHIIWRFPFGVYAKKHYVSSHYHILYFRKNKNIYTFNAEPYTLDVWDFPRHRTSGIRNANALPGELVKRCILHGSNEEDVVFDPFMGSGTTARMAVSLKRRFYGFEINEQMCEYARESLNTLNINGGLFK